MDPNNLNPLTFTQSSNSVSSGLRKLDLNCKPIQLTPLAGKGLAVANGIGGQASGFYAQNLNNQPTQTSAPFMQTNTFVQPPNVLQDDINQRQTSAMSFGNTLSSFGGQGGYQRQGSNNILNQSIDSSSSSLSSHSNFNSPAPQNQMGAGLMTSHAYMKQGSNGVMQNGFNQTRQNTVQNMATSNVFAYGAQNAQTNTQQVNQYQTPSHYSSISSAQSDYQESPFRMPSTQTTPFSYTGNGAPKSYTMPQVNSGYMVPGETNKGFKFSEIKYDSPVVVRMVPQGREEYDHPLSVRITLHAQSTTQSSKLLAIELTDETNPYFLYSLECSESDFQDIRKEQSFNFDFQTFPLYITDLLEKCMLFYKQDQSHKISRGSICTLTLGSTNEAILKILEQTQYQSLPVLLLRMRQGNDEGLKKHLAGKLKEHKEINESQTAKIFQMEDQYTQLKTQFDQLKISSKQNEEQLAHQVQGLKDENSRIVAQLKIEEGNRLNEYREKALLEQTENQTRFENEKRNYMAAQEKIIKDMHEQRQEVAAKYEQQIQEIKEAHQRQLDGLQEQIKNLLTQHHEEVVLINKRQNEKIAFYEVEHQEMVKKHAEALSSMQEKLFAKDEYVDKRKEVDYLNRALTAQIDALKHDLQQADLAHQATKDMYTNQLKFKEAEIDMLKNELGNLRDTNKGLDTYKFSQEKQLTELQLKQQSHDRELQSKDEILENLQTLVNTLRQQKDSIENSMKLQLNNINQALADEKAKTDKMQVKLEKSKADIEEASKFIQQLQKEKKDLKKKIKTKNSVVMQQETSIQKKQEQIEEQLKLINEIRRENDRQLDSQSVAANQIQLECQKKDMEIKDLNNLNQTLKLKLEECQKSLETNAQMISWLNSQLNDRNIGHNMIPSKFKNTTTSSAALNKPPLTSGTSAVGFKPSISSIDQLSTPSTNNINMPKFNSTTIERSPLHNTTNTLRSQSPAGSLNQSSSTVQSTNLGTKSSTLNNPKTFEYPSYLPSTTEGTSNENLNTNLPAQMSQPRFVSKYTQKLVEQQQFQEPTMKAPQPMNPPASLFNRQSSQSSLASAPFPATTSENNFTPAQQTPSYLSTMSFNNNQYTTSKYSVNEDHSDMQSKLSSIKLGASAISALPVDTEEGNNDTQLSGGAFAAYMSKNVEDNDDEY